MFSNTWETLTNWRKVTLWKRRNTLRNKYWHHLDDGNEIVQAVIANNALSITFKNKINPIVDQEQGYLFDIYDPDVDPNDPWVPWISLIVPPTPAKFLGNFESRDEKNFEVKTEGIAVGDVKSNMFVGNNGDVEIKSATVDSDGVMHVELNEKIDRWANSQQIPFNFRRKYYVADPKDIGSDEVYLWAKGLYVLPAQGKIGDLSTTDNITFIASATGFIEKGDISAKVTLSDLPKSIKIVKATIDDNQLTIVFNSPLVATRHSQYYDGTILDSDGTESHFYFSIDAEHMTDAPQIISAEIVNNKLIIKFSDHLSSDRYRIKISDNKIIEKGFIDFIVS